MKKMVLILSALISLFIFIDTLEVFAGAGGDAKAKQNRPESVWHKPMVGNRGHSLPADTVGLAQYMRFAVVDGNLTIGSGTNTGLFSHANLTGIWPIGWPKGPQYCDYLFGGYFYVAAEVVTNNGDTIAIVSDYYAFGELSPDSSHRYVFQALPKYYNLDEPGGGGTPLIGGISEDVGIDGIPHSHDFGENDGILQPEEDFNGNGQLDLSMQNVVGWFAINDRRQTWPEYWPAGSYPGDDRLAGEERPGARAGRWNGAYGAYAIADQESYYVMDDRENDEFPYYPFNDPTPWPNGRQGLGLTVEVRNYQWDVPKLENVWISVFDITNKGKDLEKCVIGMMIDPDIGGAYWNDDAQYDSTNNFLYAWNRSFRDPDTGLPLGYIGFVVLEGPSDSNDGVDNDNDGLTDESLYNHIDDDGDWQPWEDLNSNGVWDNEDVNFNGILDPGEDLNGNGILDWEPLNDDIGSDGIGPQRQPDYTGPDSNGTEANGAPDWGEPDFDMTDHDETDQIGVTSLYFKEHTGWMDDDQQFWDEHLQPGTFGSTPSWQTDVTFTYGSGFVEIPTDGRQRYVIALIFGWDLQELYKNKTAVELLYQNDFNYNNSVTAINNNNDSPLLNKFALYQNYPNPFNPSTIISYQLSVRSKVEVTLYNNLGQQIRSLVNANQPAGVYQVLWDGRDDEGRRVSSGIYFYRLKAGNNYSETKKMVLLR